MIDLAYLLGTLAFFAAMLAYVRACAAIGRGSESGGSSDHLARGRTP
jgi:hypothetical protein